MAYRSNLPDSRADRRQNPDKAGRARLAQDANINNLLTVGADPRRKLQRKLRSALIRIRD